MRPSSSSDNRSPGGQRPPSYVLVGDPTPPPDYSAGLRQGERVIQSTPGPSYSQSMGTVRRDAGGDTVVLVGQSDGISTPVYEQGGVVSGFIELDPTRRDNVAEVSVKLTGCLRLRLPGSASHTVKLIREKRVLWAFDSSQPSVCSPTLPFECTIPSKVSGITHGGASESLPPSFESGALVIGPSSLTAYCRYTVVVKITRSFRRLGKRVTMSRTKRIDIPFSYNPRPRPPFRTFSSLDSLSGLKTAPDEWHQRLTVIHPCRDELPSVICHLLIPSKRVFALTDPVPFHVQLSSSHLPHRELYTTRGSTRHTPEPFVHVHVLRQILLEVNGKKDWREAIIGHGILSRVQPDGGTETSIAGEESLNWEGQIKFLENLACPSFAAGGITVKVSSTSEYAGLLK
ncbi:hypothetical protein PM082_009901 [Marasmius tenuissimus]|nr:hypothetical protein PM082_009901 [Marasmius tenuissimus]